MTGLLPDLTGFFAVAGFATFYTIFCYLLLIGAYNLLREIL
ncbi:hypothetical protein GP5015_1305 [gamma proteobacterium HTCC5015]|nr:hypothetical protein GP5015_1305 [gamma proteobacterium HTCC5015]